jgi:hypothetical protein
MPRTLIALAAIATPASALFAMNAAALSPRPVPEVVTIGETGKPILLARMVVTATALPEE